MSIILGLRCPPPCYQALVEKKGGSLDEGEVAVLLRQVGPHRLVHTLCPHRLLTPSVHTAVHT